MGIYKGQWAVNVRHAWICRDGAECNKYICIYMCIWYICMWRDLTGIYLQSGKYHRLEVVKQFQGWMMRNNAGNH